jgi:4-coumarate--CoA ligase (photoactive yellow protein activation family)
VSLLARHAPTDPVAVGDAGTLTAAALAGRAGAVAAALRDLAPGPVVLLAEDRARFAAGLLGAWSAGRVVQLPPSTAPAAVEALARRAAALMHDQLRPAPDGVRVVDLSSGGAVGDSCGPLSASQVFGAADGIAGLGPTGESPSRRLLPTPSDASLVLHTSGSTGEPLAIRKSAGQLVSEARALVEAFGLAGARVAPTVPAHHIFGLLWGVLVPLLSGGAFLRETPLHAETVAAALRRHALDVLVSAPAHLRGLLALERGALPRLRRAISSGAPLPPATAVALSDAQGLVVTEVLGSTETGGVAWRRSPGEDDAWTALPGVRLDVEGGSLTVDAPWLDPGAPRPHRLADRGERLPDGRVRHLGRDDGVVKVAGKRVALLEVERALLALPGVTDAAVLALPGDEARGVELGALVVAPGKDASALRAELAAWLDPAAIPRRLVLVVRLPRADTGKLPRAAALAALAGPGRTA